MVVVVVVDLFLIKLFCFYFLFNKVWEVVECFVVAVVAFLFFVLFCFVFITTKKQEQEQQQNIKKG